MTKAKISILAMLTALSLSCGAILLGISTNPVNAVAETTVWDGTTIKQPTTLKAVDGVYYYEISTAEELAYIAKTGGDWLGYNYILTNDIYLNSVELTYNESGTLTVDESTLNKWTPIDEFSGVFNGNNYFISGVYVNITTSGAGLFASCNGYIRNLTVQNSYIKGTSSAGGICCSLSSGEGGVHMDNCHYYGVVIGKTDVGGLVGYSYYSGIANCANYGSIYGEHKVGGIAGCESSWSIGDCVNRGNIVGTGNYVGGIVGSSGNGVRNSVNYGSVSGQDYVGGIYGGCERMGGGASNCANLGNIEGSNYVGGLAGKAIRYISGYNAGSIVGKQNVGGIIGYFSAGSVSNSYGSVSNSYNIGAVHGTDTVGAIAGYSDSIWGKGTVENCYYLKNDTVNSTLNGFGNAEDMDGVAQAEGQSFFCINPDRTLNLEGHKYSSNCDATCENCNYERAVTHNYNNLRHDEENHWMECECGEIDQESIVAHSGGTATCSEKAICSECETAYGALDSENHKAAAEWTSQNGKHYHVCLNGCGEHLDEANCSGGTATCQAKAICEVCKQSYGNLGEHNFDENSWGFKSAAGHAHVCQTSGCNEHDTIQAHISSGVATEDNAEVCIDCGYVITPALEHTHSAKTEWESNEMYHWHSCTGCEGQQLDKGAHNDSDNDEKCDVCGATVSAGTMGKPNDDKNETDDDGLSAGAVAGIVIGSVSVVGISGFCIYWFVLRKKKVG